MSAAAITHKGRHANRLAPERDNPREVAFAEAWEVQNTAVPWHRPRTIDWLMYTGDQTRGEIPATEQECEIAATVIQWLGSPVGFSWLEDTLEKCGYEVKRKKDAK